MKSIIHALKLTCVTILFALSAAVVSAQSMPGRGQSDTDWRYSLGLYSFLPLSTTGTSTLSGTTVPVDLDLKDVLDLLDFALAGRFEAWSGNLGLIADVNYVSIGADGPLASTPGATYSLKVRQKWLAFLAAYRVADGTYGANNQRYTVDVQGGARLNSLRQTLNVTTSGGALPTVGGDKTWVEPVIGARGMWRLNDRWTTVGSINLGGFGAGGNDLQVEAKLGFDFQPWDNTSIEFGYQYYSIDFSTTLSNGVMAYDTAQHGPYVGVKFLFN
ncbi:hypothetical protein [Falsiruegeria litorea]|uniref:Outer membrane protein beta-barrel domain-containing protein n=1 Tax=Falsiruegeria litorea TaxID=1280831 RepID=A0ABS5WVU5_9RHOB|nr:hypothetical protein [Falsiruegeria litorea]MBT3142816.1 hypothetical protein [Falsiruegeria litorea]MBT8169192.1 hypothetical protein [Falsiruegeria litorea]